MRVAVHLLTRDPAERSDRGRRLVVAPAVVRNGGQQTSVVLRDMSATGALIETSADFEVGVSVVFGVAGMHRVDAVIVRRSGSLFGLRFAQPISEADVIAAGTANLVHFPTLKERRTPISELTVDPLPPRACFLVIVGSSALLWAGILAVIASLGR